MNAFAFKYSHGPICGRLVAILTLCCVVGPARLALAETKTANVESGGGSMPWENDDHWLPTGVPLSGDDVIVDFDNMATSDFIVHDDTPAFNSLTVTNSGVLQIRSHLTVDAPMVTGTTSVVDAFVVRVSGILDTDNLEVVGEGTRIVSTGTIIVGNVAMVGPGTEFDATNGSTSNLIFNNELASTGVLWNHEGTLNRSRQDLTVEATNGGTLDLDGQVDGSGVLLSQLGGSMTINGSINDTFSGLIRLYTGGTIEFSDDLNVDGELRFENRTNQRTQPSLTAASFTLSGGGTINTETWDGPNGGFDGIIVANSSIDNGTINVIADVTLTVDGTAAFNAGSQINIASGGEMTVESSTFVNQSAAIAADGVFRLNGTTTYKRATVSGTGFVIQNGNAIVAQDAAGPAGTDTTTIDLDPVTGVFDWDGGNDSNTSINNGAGLVVNANRIDQGTAASDGYDGRVTVNGPLTVNTADPWRLDGEMILNTAIVDGQNIVVHGTVTGGGDGIIGADVDFVDGSLLHVQSGTETKLWGDVLFDFGSQVQVNAGRQLSLGTVGFGATTWSGPASVIGGGTIVQVGDATVTAATTINLDPTTGVYDWDGGGGSATVIEPGAALVINANRIDQEPGATDGYDGVVTVNGPLTVNTAEPWRLDGEMVLNAGSVDGSKMIVHGTMIGGGDGIIGADVDFADESLLHVQSGTATVLQGNTRFDAGSQVQVDGGTTLELGPTIWDGGTASGDGTVRQNGDATVMLSTTLNVMEYDADGASGNSEITMDSSLTLNVARIDADNVYNGTANINGFARWGVNLTEPANDTWTMAGVVNVNASSAIPVRSIDGSPVNITGQVNVDGRMQFGAQFDLSGEITTADADAEVAIDGAVVPADASTLSGGTINGPGVLKASSPNRLIGFGTIDTRVDFSGSSWLMASGGTLSVSGSVLNLGQRVGTADETGVLDIATSWNTNLADELRLEGGEVRGGSITNGGIAAGHGSIAAAGFRNDGTLTADGGTLTLDTTISPDWDGGTGVGVVNATTGSIAAQNNSANLARFGGQLNIGAGRSLSLQNGGLHLIGGGRMHLRGGSYQAPLLLQDASLTVDTAPSTIDAASEFTAASDSVIETELTLAGSATIRRGAAFSGRGSLAIAKQSTLTLDAGVVVDVPISNAGQLELGSSPGRARIANFEQTSTGALHIEIGGISASQLDVLTVDRNADLDGTLRVALIDGFDPDPGVQVAIMTFESYRGGFRTLELATPSSQFPLRLDYEDDRLLVTATSIPGDVNFDGSVDRSDAAELSRNFGLSEGALWRHGDFNGDRAVTLADVGILQENYGRRIVLSAGSQIAVPEPSGVVFILASCVSAFGIRTGRRKR